jgi:putative ATPase
MQHVPLAERLRPRHLQDLIGQSHLTGEGGILQKAISSGRIPSMILWGPPGVGKTTIAHIISQTVKAPYFQLSAISSGVKDIREMIEAAKQETNAILFIDEIHRFNKGQQDALLGAVEKGIISLIGATTENPSFEVNSALLSRCQVFVLKPLGEAELVQLVQSAITTDPALQQLQIQLTETEALFRLSGGDARKLLNLLELVADTNNTVPLSITNERVIQTVQQKMALYDKKGEQHYDIISAFIKSIRGSDPNAAVYWLARMIEGGEDVKFIARRLLILASEDIGNANPNALLLANSTFDAVTKIGYPESQLILSQCTLYLAASPKSNAATTAIGKAMQAVREKGDLGVPLHIRNAPTQLMKEMGYKKGYTYAHDYEQNFLAQEYLPAPLEGTRFYEPGNNAREQEMRQFLKRLWNEKYNY